MIKSELLTYIHLANPWLKDNKKQIVADSQYVTRLQTVELLQPRWDHYITVLTGPRQVGKTTLGRYLCQQLLNQKRYPILFYLNCDEVLVREWLTGSHVIHDIQSLINTETFILFIDEVQRIDNPGLLLKSIYDLKLLIKILATGSSQLEIKSKVQEHLTGRYLESIILPFSYRELGKLFDLNNTPIYGCYPDIVMNSEKSLLLKNLYESYINKDIIEVLKLKNADTVRRLLTLIAHGSGQLVNYQQLATDCRVSSHTIQHYLNILESTYVVTAVKPFVGNKRTEITSNPIYYFIDNGFRNQALNNFSPLENRTDMGLLIQSAVFQELYKYKTQYYKNFEIYYWRTKAGAEVDFVLSISPEECIPIEVKYRNFKEAKISRGFRSFLEAYQPKKSIVITQNIHDKKMINHCEVHFIPFSDIKEGLFLINDYNSVVDK